MFLAGYNMNGSVLWAKTYELGSVNSLEPAPDSTLIMGGAFGVTIFGAIVHLDTVALDYWNRTAFVVKMSMADIGLGTTDLEASSPIQCFPVPAQDRIMITLAEPRGKAVPFSVYDPSGRLVANGALKDAVNALELSRFANGTYVLRTNDGRTARFVVQH